ncbi:MAG TPA: iron uptake system protein EfeO [Alphaproteobacteria bacterium]|nr:iron uptake system protein EfeO [Alphaproteobacteria bacterium]
MRLPLPLIALGLGLLTATAEAVEAPVSPLALVTPIADYKVFVGQCLDQLVADTEAFTAAVKAGDLDKARALYAPARFSYEAIEPVAELFSDLDAAIDSRADDHELAEKDPGFTGFHRIEYGLFAPGAGTSDLAGYADRLMTDVNDLDQRLAGLTFPPMTVVGGAAALMEEVAASKISGEEDRYSHTDLWDFEANVEGSKTIYDLLRPLIADANADYVAKVDSNFATVLETLAKYRKGQGFETYDKLTDRDRNVLAGAVNTLAEDLSMLSGLLGLG